jgi:glycosyltransferase involved in cell wall biosynthesis
MPQTDGAPLVSIVTPSYNQGRFIEETIESVLSQDYPNLEYIVIDGGSTDETLAILRRYEGRLTWITEPDGGQSEAINKGFRRARGEIVAWLNSDDTYLAGAVSKAVAYLHAHPEVAMVYGEGYLMDEAGRVTSRFPATEPFNFWRLVHFSDYILQQTVFWRRSVFESVGMLDESLHYGMDWDFWIRVAKRFEVAYIPEFLGNLREYATAKTFAGGMQRFDELAGMMRRHGTRRFPPAYFNYGWDAYEKALGERFRRVLPLLDRPKVRRLARKAGRVGANLLFGMLSRRYPPSPYTDGWAADRTYFLLPRKGDERRLRIAGTTAEVPPRLVPMEVEGQLNHRHRFRIDLTRRADFEVEILLPDALRDAPVLEVALHASRSFVPSAFGGSDHRRLSFQVKEVSLR